MSLLSLNDDVLLAIFANLHGQDALNVSLTSQRAYALAGPRIPSHITCSSPEHLRRLHTYLLSPFPNGITRSRFLEQFIVDASTFEEPGDGEEDHSDAYYASNFSQAHLLGDILLEARNLRELSVERFQPCLAQDPRIGEAVGSLDSLASLRLFTIADYALTVFDSSRCDRLARLTLSYHVPEEFPLQNNTLSLPPLVSLLRNFCYLHTVKLWNFNPKMGLIRSEETFVPSFPSIRYLRLSECSVPALDIVGLCPNLSILIISLAWGAEPIVSEGPKWPPLRRLMVTQFGDILSFCSRLSTVDQLQISGPLRLTSDRDSSTDDPLHHFLALLRNTSPVGLYMCMQGCMETDGQKAFWNDVPRHVPRLRSLELQLYPPLTESDTDDYSWLDKLTIALASLPLVCFRLLVPQEELTRVYMWGADEEEKEQALAHAREQEVNRVKALAAIPHLLLRSLPSLQYLSVGDAAPNMVLLGDTIADDFVTGLHVRDEDVVWEWDELRRLSIVRKQRWWRVVDRPLGRELVEISEEEGEEAQLRIETMTDDTTAHIERAMKSLVL